MKERQHYIDIAKGILMLMVVYGHVWYVLCNNLNYENENINILHSLVNVWAAFFIPAFFVITGLCSNFNKPAKVFLVNQIKSLLVPAFTLGLISDILGYIFGEGSFGIKGFILGTTYWFIFALFVAKILFFVLNKNFQNKYLIFSITIFIYYTIVILLNILPNIPAYWSIKHACLLIPFLAIGQYIKANNVIINNKKQVILIGSIYILLLIVYIVGGYRIPRIAGGCYVPLNHSIQCLIMSFSGSILILYVSRIISKSYILELIGKHSLVIYCLHVSIIYILSPFFATSIIKASFSDAILLYSMIFIYPVIISLGISYVLHSKYFCFLLGKSNKSNYSMKNKVKIE